MTEEYPILDPEFRKVVRSYPNDSYDVRVLVFYDEKETNPETRFHNKRKLEKFVDDKKVLVHNELEYLPSMSLRMSGFQVLELAKKDYIQNITKNETVATTAE